MEPPDTLLSLGLLGLLWASSTLPVTLAGPALLSESTTDTSLPNRATTSTSSPCGSLLELPSCAPLRCDLDHPYCGPAQTCDFRRNVCVADPAHCSNLLLRACNCDYSIRFCFCDPNVDPYRCDPKRQQCATTCLFYSGDLFVIAIPLLVGASTCLLVAVLTICLCKVVVRRYVRFGAASGRSSSGDSDSVSSMQRWINQRLREDPPPPRYEERYEGPPVTPATPAAPSPGHTTADLKPPPYEVAIHGTRAAGNLHLALHQPPAVFLVEPSEEGFLNPAFVGDSAPAAAAAAAPGLVTVSQVVSTSDREAVS